MVRSILRDALGEPEDTPDFGQVSSDVEEGLGQKAIEAGGKGLGHLGDLLDVPGAFVRGVVGSALSLGRGEFGRAGERLVSALPGSEELPKMFGGEGYRAPTGQDLLADIGVDKSNTMDEERRIRVAMAAGLTRSEAQRKFTTRYEEEALTPEMQAEFKTVLQRALEMNPNLKTGVTMDDIKRATEADDFLGFAAEIALDPLTYFTFGASAVGKAAKATKAITNAVKIATGPGEDGIKAAGRVMKLLGSAESLDHARAVAKAIPGSADDKARLVMTLEEAWKGGKPDLELGSTLMEQIKRGQFKAGFKLPFVDNPVLEDGATKALELVGNGIGGLGKGMMKIRPVAEFVAKHPGASQWPKRLWLKLAGEGRKADVLGNEKLTEIFLHEQAFNRSAGAEALKWQGALKRDTARALNGLTEAQRKTVLELAPDVVEHGVAVGRVIDEPTAKALDDYAAIIAQSDADLFALQSKWGLGVHELSEDFNHFGRQLSDELMDFLNKRPDARKAWLGAKTKMGRDLLSRGLLDVERGRVLKGMDFKEAEKFMREALKDFDLPANMSIWNMDAAQVLLRRSEKSLEAAKIRNLAHVASEVYGETAEGVVDAARNVVRGLVDAPPPPRPVAQVVETTISGEAQRSAKASHLQRLIDDGERAAARKRKAGEDWAIMAPRAKAEAESAIKAGADAKIRLDKLATEPLPAPQRVRNQPVSEAQPAAVSTGGLAVAPPKVKAERVLAALREQGLAPPVGQISALELAMKSKVKLSDDLEDLAALGVKFLNDADGKEFTRYANKHYWHHLETPSRLGKVYDAIKGIYQRSTLARVASLSRDLIGTTSQSLMAGNQKHLGRAVKDLGSLEDWAKGLKEMPDDIIALQAAGVLRTTKGEALEGVGALKGVPLLGNVEESGVVGGTLRSLGAEKAGKFTGEKIGKLNDARVYWEEANRVATYRKAISEGATHDDAIGEVFKYWGNFSELSKLEGKVLNRVMFFWSWMARSVPTSLQTMLAHPAKARLALTLIAGNVSNSDSMPEWMQRMGGWTLGQDDNGNYQVINLGNSTYFSPTMSGLQSDMIKELTQGNFGRAGGEAMREVARSAPPFIGAAYERMTETETFSNERWWSDPKNRVGTKLKAPAGFYWLEKTPLADYLGLKVVDEPSVDGRRIKQVYMDPEKANILSFIPGFEPAMTDASSFMDPRKQAEPGFSPGKGALRMLGVPVYSVEQQNDLKREAKQFRRLLADSIDAMPGNALASNGNNVYPNKNSERGRKLKELRDSLYDQARSQGMDKKAANEWTYRHLATQFPDESRWLKLDAQIRLLEKLAEPDDDDKAGLGSRPVQSGLGSR